MKKIKINKSKLLLGIPLALISLRIYLGVLFGYFFARFLSTRINSIILSIGSHKLHFHHWIMGFIALIFILWYSFSPLIDQLVFGFLGGLIFEGISSYPDWYKVIIRKE
ncbi:MAG: hypothetical protein ACKKMR_00660 [Candidatus Nealsonbacteria bacterium]